MESASTIFIHELRCIEKVRCVHSFFWRIATREWRPFKDFSCSNLYIPRPFKKGKRKKSRLFEDIDYLRVLANQFYTFDLHTITYQHAWLFIGVVRQFCSESLKACHLAIKTFVHAQTFDCCVSKEALAQ